MSPNLVQQIKLKILAVIDYVTDIRLDYRLTETLVLYKSQARPPGGTTSPSAAPAGAGSASVERPSKATPPTLRVQTSFCTCRVRGLAVLCACRV